MTARALLADLRRRGATVQACGGRLVIEAPKGRVTETLRQSLAAHKNELLTLLTDNRLDLEGCLTMLHGLHAELKSWGIVTVGDAYLWAMQMPNLRQRFEVTETHIDTLAGTEGGPTAAQFRTAIEEHRKVWVELVERYREGWVPQ